MKNTRIQCYVDDKTADLLEILKEDNPGVNVSEVIRNGVWLYAEQKSPESLATLRQKNLNLVKERFGNENEG